MQLDFFDELVLDTVGGKACMELSTSCWILFWVYYASLKDIIRPGMPSSSIFSEKLNLDKNEEKKNWLS